MTADQVNAFVSNAGFSPAATASLMLSVLFALLLLWGAWALRVAFVGWTDMQLSQRQLFVVLIRVVALYLLLTFFLLS